MCGLRGLPITREVAPSSLTSLALCDYRNRRTAGAAAASILSISEQHSRLQRLELTRCIFLPSVLTSMPDLEHLELQDVCALGVPGPHFAALTASTQLTALIWGHSGTVPVLRSATRVCNVPCWQAAARPEAAAPQRQGG